MDTNASLFYYKEKYEAGTCEAEIKISHYGRGIEGKTIFELLGITGDCSLDSKINGIDYKDYFSIQGASYFCLKVVYPGLVIGVGYNHPVIKKTEKGEQSDFQLGFYFDYTTGLPVIPGSTIKGILKSVFPKIYPKKENSDEVGDSDEVVKNKLEYLNAYLKEVTGKENILDGANWNNLFEQGNVFYDAFICSISSDGKIFADDYITPHKCIFTDPTPIRFLKIRSGVIFKFQFKLKETKLRDNNIITVVQKLILFKKILLDFGVGAKRNVGYGNFV